MHKYQCLDCGNTFINATSYNVHRTPARKVHVVPAGHGHIPPEKRGVMEFDGRGGSGNVTVGWLPGTCVLGDKFEAFGGMLGLKKTNELVDYILKTRNITRSVANVA